MSGHNDEVPQQSQPTPEPLNIEPVDHDYIKKEANSEDIEHREIRSDESK